MAFRDYGWYCKRYEEQKEVVASIKMSVQMYIDHAEYSSAAMRCEHLKDALESLNDIANKCADLMPE